MLAYPSDIDDDPHLIIGATLCLMSCVMQSGNKFYLPRISENLAMLAAHPNVDANFRRICRKLFEHWEGSLNVPGLHLPTASTAPVGKLH